MKRMAAFMLSFVLFGLAAVGIVVLWFDRRRQ